MLLIRHMGPAGADKTPSGPSPSATVSPFVPAARVPPQISRRNRAMTQLHDLPDALLRDVFALVGDVRARNAMALVCRKWQAMERATRTALALRGNVGNLLFIPACFPAVTHLDLSLLSPWGHPFLHPHPPLYGDPTDDYNNELSEQELIARRLHQAFPNVISLTVYARHQSTLRSLAPQWPALRHAKLVRWHQRPNHPPGSDLAPLLAACPALTSLDLSSFYYWTEDIPPALQAHPATAASLTHVDLLSASSVEGFRSHELVAIAAACPALHRFLAPCVFNPRYLDFVGDDALLALATQCPNLSLLHLVDAATLAPTAAPPNPGPGPDGFAPEDSRLTPAGLERLFAALPLLEDLALDLCQNVRDAGPALETLSYKCLRIRSLELGQFHGVCRAAGLHLDGVAVCGGLESLCIKNSADLTDSSLVAIARGCRRLSKLVLHGCTRVTEMGLKKMAGMLRSTLVDVRISNCQRLDAAGSLRALEPVRDWIQRLHIDCIWVRPGVEHAENSQKHIDDFDLDEVEHDIEREESDEADHFNNKRCRYSQAVPDGWPADMNPLNYNGDSCFSSRTWTRLRYLSLWLAAGEVLTPLADAGLESCPELEEISIKVEGDCRSCPKPTHRVFGLSSLICYPKLSKMKLDCGEAIGYALTAPTGQMDLSLWERFYLHGIGDLGLYELDYWPPQDKEVNQRTLSLPAAGLLKGCATLRKLFIHGTAHEHFMRFFLEMQNLRDVQLREDYYPAPENDMSTEMRVDSCSRFEEALNSRRIPV